MWEEADKFLRKDKYLKPLIEKYGPCRIKPIKKSEYFIDLVEAICSQQLSGKAARTIFERVKLKLGGEITPQKIKKVRASELRKCGLSNAKYTYVKDLAERVLSRKLKIKSLDKLSDDEVFNELVAVAGIGRWTADMFLMFSLARADIFPSGDLGIKNGIKKITGKDMNQIQMVNFAKRWAPYRTVASWYLWRLLDNR
ncbi:DNA-3-methyladenine glycosylase 2 family protein [Patescibacteria group bacterium]|nr:DNA-3-methyladenine glycosylase 2 family protein [Patescibacteria group bacterium]